MELRRVFGRSRVDFMRLINYFEGNRARVGKSICFLVLRHLSSMRMKEPDFVLDILPPSPLSPLSGEILL